MKAKLFIQFILVYPILLLFSCKSNDKKMPDNTKQEIVVFDSVAYPVKDTVRIDLGYQKKYDSLFLLLAKKNIEKDSLNRINILLAKDLLQKKLIIQNAQYYLNITIKNPSQDKFLKGWMRRALNQETK